MTVHALEGRGDRVAGAARRNASAWACALVFLASGAFACSAATRPGPARARAAAPPDPIHVVADDRVSARLEDLTLSTPVLTHPVHVDVLVPVSYRSEPHRRFPVIYFLHGGSPGPDTGLEYQEWLTAGDAEGIIGDDPVIGVFPEAGSGGWYTDWYNGGKGGNPEWETFHVRELVPWIDAHYRTIANRDERAAIGLSMGGYGAMEYAARFPSVFGAAASFSGAPDIGDPPPVAKEAEMIVGVMARGEGANADAPFGDPVRDIRNWRTHDPADHVAGLSHTHLYLYCGNGTPGPLDNAATISAFTKGIEFVVFQSTWAFATVLAQHHIAAYVDLYGPGTHSWGYWQRDLRDALPRIMRDFSVR